MLGMFYIHLRTQHRARVVYLCSVNSVGIKHGSRNLYCVIILSKYESLCIVILIWVFKQGKHESFPHCGSPAKIEFLRMVRNNF